jgi:hypothetical protein
MDTGFMKRVNWWSQFGVEGLDYFGSIWQIMRREFDVDATNFSSLFLLKKIKQTSLRTRDLSVGADVTENT